MRNSCHSNLKHPSTCGKSILRKLYNTSLFFWIILYYLQFLFSYYINCNLALLFNYISILLYSKNCKLYKVNSEVFGQLQRQFSLLQINSRSNGHYKVLCFYFSILRKWNLESSGNRRPMPQLDCNGIITFVGLLWNHCRNFTSMSLRISVN